MSNEIATRSNDIILRPNYAPSRRAQRETLTIHGVQMIYCNFAGKKGPFNEEGERDFCILLDEGLASELRDRGLNIKPRKNLDDDGANPEFYLPVSVSYKIRPPRVYMVTGDGSDLLPFRKTLLPQSNLEMMDSLEFSETNLTLNVSHYDVRGTKGKKCYLQSLFAHVLMDELEQQYAHIEDMMFEDAEVHKEVDIIEGELV